MIVCRGCHYWQKKIPHFEGMRSEPLQNGQTQPQDASGCLRYRSLPGVGGRGRSPLIFWISNPHASLFWQPNRSELPAILKSLKDWMRMAERRCLAKWLSCLRLHLISLITPALSYCFPFEVPLGVYFHACFHCHRGVCPIFRRIQSRHKMWVKPCVVPFYCHFHPFSPMFCGVIPPVSRVPKPPVGSGASSSQPGAQLLAEISQEDGVAAEVD